MVDVMLQSAISANDADSMFLSPDYGCHVVIFSVGCQRTKTTQIETHRTHR